MTLFSRRAFESYEKEGRVDGQDLRHLAGSRSAKFWHPVHMKLEDAEGDL